MPALEPHMCLVHSTRHFNVRYTIRKRVPKEAIEDLEAVTPLPPNTRAFTIGNIRVVQQGHSQQRLLLLLSTLWSSFSGKCVYSAETSKTGRPPLLIGGILIANTSDAPKTDSSSSSSQQKDPKGGQSKSLTPAEVYDKLATGLPAQYENVQKAVKATVDDFREFYPVFKVAMGKTADELPGQLKM